MEVIKGVNLGVTFLLEVALLAALGVWGFAAGGGGVLSWVLGLGAPILVAVFWGVFMAPKAVRPLRAPLHQLVELGLFGLGVAALYVAGQPTWALVFALVFIVNFLLRVVWKQGTTDRRPA